MANKREVNEGLQYQGVDEEVVYSITTTPWGSDPSGPTAVLLDPDGEDVSATMLSGAPNATGDVITTPIVKSLIAGELYRLDIKFTAGGQVLECYFEILAEG
jgi:hypothetical protein